MEQTPDSGLRLPVVTIFIMQHGPLLEESFWDHFWKCLLGPLGCGRVIVRGTVFSLGNHFLSMLRFLKDKRRDSLVGFWCVVCVAFSNQWVQFSLHVWVLFSCPSLWALGFWVDSLFGCAFSRFLKKKKKKLVGFVGKYIKTPPMIGKQVYKCGNNSTRSGGITSNCQVK